MTNKLTECDLYTVHPDQKNYDSLKIAPMQWQYCYDSNSELNTSETGGIEAICIDNNGCTWFGSGGPIYQVKDSIWTTHEADNVNTDSIIFNISSVFYDSTRNTIWFGSRYYGVGKYMNNSWTRYDHKEYGGFCSSICVDKLGNAYGKCHNSLFYYDNKKNTSVFFARSHHPSTSNSFSNGGWEKIFEHPYCNLTVDNNGYVSTLYENNIIKLKHGKWISIPLPEAFKHNSHSECDIAFNSKGVTWISIIDNYDKKLIKIAGNQFQIFNTSDLPNYFDVIKCIQVDQNGDAWFGFGYNGVAKFDCKTWTTFTPDNSLLSDKEVETIYLDKEERLWIGTDSGVFIFKNGNRN